MQRIRRLIHEVHRRSLWQVLGLYVFGSWAVYQIIAEVTDRMGMPDWVPGFAIVLFLIGLPIVLATAFVQEGLPGQTTAPPPLPLDGPADATLVPGLHLAGGERDGTPARSRLLEPARPHFFLTWQRSVLAGIVAFLLLGITAGSYLGLRNAGVGPFASLITSGALDARDRIIVAELEHAARDTITAAAITEALRVDLAQSPVLNVVESRFIGDALQRMGRSRDERLNGALAREVAIREGVKAVLEGEISPAGSGYIITARLLRAATGELLVSHRETATGDDQIIAAIDRLSKRLRAAIGESLRTVRADAPLEKVTTSSLTALQRYTQGVRAIDMERDYDRAIQLLSDAVAEDSTFSMAWRKLSVAYYNSGGGASRRDHAARRAYALRDRLTERERYHTLAFYHLNITHDIGAAITAYRSLLEIHPDDHAALNNIALAYGRLRDLDNAALYYRRRLAVDSASPSTWTNLMMTEYRRGNREEAHALLAEATRRFPDQRDNRGFAATLAQAEGRYAESERMMRDLLAESRSSDVWRARANFGLGSLLLMQGRGAEARRHFLEGADANRARGVPGTEVGPELGMADYELSVLLRPDLAARRISALLSSDAWRNTPPGSRGHLFAAWIIALSGNPGQARELIAEWDALPEDERNDPGWERLGSLGAIAIAEGRGDDAVTHLRQAAAIGECTHCGYAALAMAFEAAARTDSAITYYRRYIDTPSMTRLPTDALDLPRSYERLAELYAEVGDTDNSRRYAGLFVELWKNADPDLQPRVRAKQQLLLRGGDR
jgi:eukaryotic-like serine/threonine-protein kinase